MADVDLSGLQIVDAHTHPYRTEDLLERGSEGFDTRATFLGESFSSSSRLDPELWPTADRLTDSTVMGIAIVRWLARHLDSAGVVAVLADEGYPQPPIPAPEFAGTIGVPVHRVARLEPWILARRERTFDDLVAGVEADAIEAASDPNCVAYKSIVAYRTGLDVSDPSPSEAAEAFTRWRADGWGETRADAKPVRDFLIRRTLAVARGHDRAFHFHCGGGDPDIDLQHASPKGLFP